MHGPRERATVYKAGSASSANAARPVSNRFSRSSNSTSITSRNLRRAATSFSPGVPERPNLVNYVRGARRRVRALQLRLRQAHLHGARRQAEKQTRGCGAHESLRPERPFQKDSYQADEHRAQQTADKQEQGVEITDVPIFATGVIKLDLISQDSPAT